MQSPYNWWPPKPSRNPGLFPEYLFYDVLIILFLLWEFISFFVSRSWKLGLPQPNFGLIFGLWFKLWDTWLWWNIKWDCPVSIFLPYFSFNMSSSNFLVLFPKRCLKFWLAPIFSFKYNPRTRKSYTPSILFLFLLI